MQEGRKESEPSRTAPVEAAQLRQQRAAIAEEARRLGADPVDRAETQAILADFEPLAPH